MKETFDFGGIMKKRILSLLAFFSAAFALFAQTENYKTYETTDTLRARLRLKVL